MPDRDVSEPYIERNHPDPEAPLHGGRPADASNADLEGYDEAQRAEIAEVEGGGPQMDGVLRDLDPDMGEDLDEDEIEDGADDLTQVIDTDSDFR